MNVAWNRNVQDLLRSTSSPLHKSTLIVEEAFTVSFLQKKEIVYNQCWAIGFCILELSKFIMQKLYYDVLQPRLGVGNIALNMTDTDSFLLTINAKSEEEVLKKLSDVMDFSNFPPSHPLYSAANKKVPGYLKSEMPDVCILHAYCLRSKCYALTTSAQAELAKCKGVSNAAKPKAAEYAKCIENVSSVRVQSTRLRARNHINELVSENKQAFTSFDDKRFYQCAVHSCPYGSALINWFVQHDNKCYFCHRGKNVLL